MIQSAAGGRVLVVIPALNEAASVAAVVRDVREKVVGADILVVDDASTDRTSAVAAAAGAMVVRLPINLGVGGAMRAGFRYARREGYDAVVQVDGDGQHDAAYVPALLAALASSDVVIGARFAGVGDYRLRGPRSWAIRVLSATLGRLVGARLTDATSGFRASNRRAIGVFAVHYPAEYLGDTVESLVIAHRLRLRVEQVPVAMRPRGTGRASQGIVASVLYLGRASAALALALVRRWPYQEDE